LGIKTAFSSSANADGSRNMDIVNGLYFPVATCPSNPMSHTGKPVNQATFEAVPSTPTPIMVQEGMYRIVGGPIGATASKDCSSAADFCYKGNSANGNAGWVTPHKFPNATRGMAARGVSSIRTSDVTDGTSNTMLLGETKPHYTIYGSIWAYNIPMTLFHLKLNSTWLNQNISNNSGDWGNGSGHASYHTGGAHFTFVDGSVRFIGDNIDYRTYCNLGDRMDGEVLGEF
ncbi:MAG TPA: DUF1559 domain-containing protein, partial [Planctomicrobium sp.]|nr:DUF1559 domain-containing protein [Planctomicrobium sp.]